MNKISRPKIIAIDFDDTIADNSFPDISKAILKDKADIIINELYEEGYYIIIWTCRFTEKHIQDCINFLNAHNIKYHKINENYPELEFKPLPKIYYDVLIDDKCLLKIDWIDIYYFIKNKLNENYIYITQEMVNWFKTRTTNHINLVQKYCYRICKLPSLSFNESLGIIKQGLSHDKLKWQNPERSPYILITWSYYCKDHNIEFNISSDIQDLMNKATEHHIINSYHHPEYWTDKKTNLINKKDRDSNNITIDSKTGKTFYTKTIDATKMNKLAIYEMCADWCAMSEERSNTPFEWAEKVINKRWYFNKDQINLIYNTLNKIWQI